MVPVDENHCGGKNWPGVDGKRTFERSPRGCGGYHVFEAARMKKYRKLEAKLKIKTLL